MGLDIQQRENKNKENCNIQESWGATKDKDKKIANRKTIMMEIIYKLKFTYPRIIKN